MHELGRRLPDRDEATWRVIRSHVERIARQDVPPREAMSALLDEIELPSPEQFVGDSHDLQRLIGAHYGFDDLEERPGEVSCDGLYRSAAIQVLERHVIELARDWLATHGG